MAAGQGFKTFTTGEVLTAGDVNGYLMQGVLVFASAAARDAAITSPQEGQFAFTKDTNGLWYYDGAAWVASGATGDIEGVTAGVGISGGGTSGTVTVTNSMATAIDAKGDLVAGTGADTFAKLTVGANNTVLTADSAEATGLKWAAPSASGASWTLINSPSGTALTGAQTVTVSSISGYNQLMVLIGTASSASASSEIGIRFNGNTTGATYGWFGFNNNIGASYAQTDYGIGYDGGSNGYWWLGTSPNAARTTSGGLLISGANTSAIKMVDSIGAGFAISGTAQQVFLKGFVNITAAITSVSAFSSVGNFDGGTMWIYGSAV